MAQYCWLLTWWFHCEPRMNYMPKSRPIHSRPIIDFLCMFFFSRFHQISFVFTNGWVFYWVTLSSIYRMVLVFVIFLFLFVHFCFIIWNEMIAKAWHKMPLAKSKLLVKVCQQNAIRFKFAFFFCPWHLDWIVCIAHFYLFIITVRISATPAKAWLYANIPTTNDFEFIYFNE